MDSLTQATLGAAVGEAIFGKNIGYKAPLIGAVLGTLPDLDIIANPVLSNINELYFHRSISHSFFFVFIVSPLLGWILNRYTNKNDISWKKWSFFTFWILLTHILIDIPTSYGTQVFQPFSNYPLTTDSIFIIDPIFTFPLGGCVIAAQFLNRELPYRLWINRTGLILAASYLIWAIGIKAHVHSVFDSLFKAETGYYEKIKTMPNGPTTFLWTGLAEKRDTIYVSIYSIFDDSATHHVHRIPKNTHLIEKYTDSPAVKAALWFSRGYYHVEKTDEDVFFHDLRFGKTDFWINENSNSDYVWTYELIFHDNRDEVINFELRGPSFNLNSKVLNSYLARLY